MPPRKKTRQKKLGLALGGGGAAGFCHIGILDVLEKNKIQISAISGTSMGAIIGGLYSIGLTPTQLQEFAEKAADERLFKFRNFNVFNESLIKPDNFIALLENALQNKTFADCKIPLAVKAVDIESGKEVILKEGPLLPALLASSAIPLIFPPVFHQNRILVDGGLLDNVPVGLLKNMGTKINMGVEIASFKSRQTISGEIFQHYYSPSYQDMFKQPHFFTRISENIHFMADLVLRAFEIASEENTKRREKRARPNLLLKPNLNVGLLSTEKIGHAIEVGRRSMEKDLPRLLTLLK